MSKYYGNFKTVDSHNSVPFEFDDKDDAIETMKKIARGNARRRIRATWHVYDEQGNSVSGGYVYNRAK